MRGNTSLLSHLLGNHPQVEGYYEMHIGYYSWKSLFRQKMLYADSHRLKPTSRYVFDKVLHNEHNLSAEFLADIHAKVIIMVREPLKTIRSIVSLYQRVEPGHEWCEVGNAAAYYQKRLKYILELQKKMTNQYLYVDSDLLRSEPELQLERIRQYVGLTTPINTEYKLQEKTGETFYGDSSENIKKGTIVKSATDYSHIDVDQNILADLKHEYEKTKKILVEGSSI